VEQFSYFAIVNSLAILIQCLIIFFILSIILKILPVILLQCYHFAKLLGHHRDFVSGHGGVGARGER
jgi:hypothetical protein